MSMIDQRERAILSLSLANWNRLLDDIRMGRAAKRIRSDGEKIKQLQSLYDSEISKSNHIIDMYGKLVSHSTKESKLGKAFYHWLIKSQRIIYRQALIVIEELKKKTKLMSHSLLEDNAQNETSNQPPLHFAEEFISLKSEQTERVFGAPPWPSPFDIRPLNNYSPPAYSVRDNSSGAHTPLVTEPVIAPPSVVTPSTAAPVRTAAPGPAAPRRCAPGRAPSSPTDAGRGRD